MGKIIKTSSVLFGIFFLFTVSVHAANAASLWISPASTHLAVGTTASFKVGVNAGSDYVNAIQANFTYPSDKLQFVGIYTGGSALTIFAEKSAGGGLVRIGGGTPSPGINGNKLIATISFKVLASTGSGSLNFTGDSSVLRNSDNSNILGAKVGSQFNFTSVIPTTPTQPVSESSTFTIDNVNVAEANRDTATIEWKTSVPSTTTVEYGLDTSYGFSYTQPNFITDHKVVLDKNLIAGNIYHYRVSGSNTKGEKVIGSDMTFTTPGYSVVIHVLNGAKKPVSGASITLYSTALEGTTDEQGNATFTNVSTGTHGLVIRYNGKTQVSSLEVRSDSDSTETTITLQDTADITTKMISLFKSYWYILAILLAVLAIVLIIMRRRNNKHTVVSDIAAPLTEKQISTDNEIVNSTGDIPQK